MKRYFVLTVMLLATALTMAGLLPREQFFAHAKSEVGPIQNLPTKEAPLIIDEKASNSSYPQTGSMKRFFDPNSRFKGRAGLLPSDGKPVILIYSMAGSR